MEGRKPVDMRPKVDEADDNDNDANAFGFHKEHGIPTYRGPPPPDFAGVFCLCLVST